MDPLSTAVAFLFFGFIAIVLLVIAIKTIRIVPQATVMLVERLGRFDKVASSGLNILIPFMDRPRAVYWTNTRPGIPSIDLRNGRCVRLLKTHPSLRAALMITAPPVALGASPCRMAFSTSGCRNMEGTSACLTSWAKSMLTRR